MCPRRGWLGRLYNNDWADRVSELKRLAQHWADYEDAWCILSCASALKDALLKILCTVCVTSSWLFLVDCPQTKVEPEEHKCNSALLNDTMVLKHDILNLASLAVICITGERKQDILGKSGGQVRKLIELFHDVRYTGSSRWPGRDTDRVPSCLNPTWTLRSVIEGVS